MKHFYKETGVFQELLKENLPSIFIYLTIEIFIFFIDGDQPKLITEISVENFVAMLNLGYILSLVGLFSTLYFVFIKKKSHLLDNHFNIIFFLVSFYNITDKYILTNLSNKAFNLNKKEIISFFLFFFIGFIIFPFLIIFTPFIMFNLIHEMFEGKPEKVKSFKLAENFN